MKTLKFDSRRLADDMCDMLIASADEIMEHFKHDAEAKLKSTDFETIDAVYHEAYQIIHSECIFYGWSILESYGKGQEMELDNEFLSSYLFNIDMGWNPARLTKKIVGRPKGSYINFFGEEVETGGSREGKDIGGFGKSRAGNRAIQNAEQILKQGGYIKRILDRNTAEFFSRLNASKYFVFN